MTEANRRKKKKKDIILLSVISFLVLLGILAAILIPVIRNNQRLDRAERILKEEGFNLVTRSGEGSSRPTGNEKVAGRVEGKGGPNGEYITVVKFYNEEDAKLTYDAVKDDFTMMQTAVREGVYVYYGTRTTYEKIK